jgi:membrane-associated phospholipid phosphatase
MICFVSIALLRSSFSTIDLDVNIWAASINSSNFTPIAMAISAAFDSLPLTAASGVLALVLFVKKRGKYSLLLLGAMGGDILIVSLCKTIVALPRPPNEILAETGYAFPSGHVTGNIVFFGILAYIVLKNWGSLKIKAATASLYITVIALIAFDRIYLNVHWFSDILGSVFLGSFLVLLSIAVFTYFVSRKKQERLTIFGKT